MPLFRDTNRAGRGTVREDRVDDLLTDGQEQGQIPTIEVGVFSRGDS